MMARSKWSVNEIELLIKMTNDGCSIKDIAKKLSRSYKAVSCRRSILFKEKRLKKIRISVPWKQSEIDKLQELRRQGVSKYGIARIINRRESSVYSKIRQLEKEVCESW